MSQFDQPTYIPSGAQDVDLPPTYRIVDKKIVSHPSLVFYSIGRTPLILGFMNHQPKGDKNFIS
jgi:hypothetical protein